MERGQKLALAHELVPTALRAYNNLADQLGRRDRCEECGPARAVARARAPGRRPWLRANLAGRALLVAGAHRPVAEALECIEQVPEEPVESGTFLLALSGGARCPGKLEDGAAAPHPFTPGSRAQSTSRSAFRSGRAQAVVLAAEGSEREALDSPRMCSPGSPSLGLMDQGIKVAFPVALDALLALGEHRQAEQLLETIETLPPGRLAPSLRAHASQGASASRPRAATAAGRRFPRRRPRPSARPACRSGSRSR